VTWASASPARPLPMRSASTLQCTRAPTAHHFFPSRIYTTVRNWFLVFTMVAGTGLAHAACDPKDFAGNYGFLLTGTTTIGGDARPVASVGRLTLDGWGVARSTSSAAFTGIVLGSPAKGTYEAQSDCSVRWSLRDDGGNWQNFAGSMADRGARVTFRQTDPAGAGNGLMLRVPDSCSASSLQGRFDLTLSGHSVDVYSGRAFGRVSFGGSVVADGAGGVSFLTGTDAPTVKAGRYDFEDGCFVQLTVPPVGGSKASEMHFRGILVDDGRTIFAMQIDPGAVVSLRFARPEPLPEPK
jgi:hypothetical protein